MDFGIASVAARPDTMPTDTAVSGSLAGKSGTCEAMDAMLRRQPTGRTRSSSRLASDMEV